MIPDINTTRRSRLSNRISAEYVLDDMADTLGGRLLTIQQVPDEFGVGKCQKCRKRLLFVGACRVYGRWSALKLSADGESRLFGCEETCAVTVLPGSIVLPELAWLRIRAENGDTWGELVAGNHRQSKEWRRFQVIFRHLNTC